VKKILALSVAIGLAIGLVGCGSATTPAAKKSEAGAGKTDHKDTGTGEVKKTEEKKTEEKKDDKKTEEKKTEAKKTEKTEK